MLSETGRTILRAISRCSPELYAELEKKAEYLDEDSFVGSSEEYDDAVDQAELKALKDLIEEELK